MRLALTLLFTYPGAPCLYYGDEVGMSGGPDPDCRRCFNWDRASWNADLLAHVRTLAGLRKSRREWRAGAHLALGAGEDWIAYARFTGWEATIVCANRGEATTVDLPIQRLPLAVPRWKEAGGKDAAGKNTGGESLSARNGSLTVQVPGGSSLVLLGAD
jgi:alpha-glucosidase